VAYLHSILGNFKQLHSNLNNLQPLHLKLHAFRNIWANYNSLDHIWVIETAAFKLGHNKNHLGKLEECHSDLHVLYIFEQITTAKIKIGPTETTLFKCG